MAIRKVYYLIIVLIILSSITGSGSISEEPEDNSTLTSDDIFKDYNNKPVLIASTKIKEENGINVSDIEFSIAGSKGLINIKITDLDVNKGIDNVTSSTTNKILIEGKSVKEAMLVTDIFAMTNSSFNNATISLPFSHNVDFIVKCKDWDFESNTCKGTWEQTKIPFTETNNITFIVDSFSGYGGASITVLNIFSYPKAGDNWTVYYETTGTANLTISGIDNTNWTEFLTDVPATDNDELKFLDIKCGNTSLKDNLYVIKEDDSLMKYTNLTEADSILVKALLIPDYTCNEIGTIKNNVLIAGYATLKFEFGNSTAYAYDPSEITLFYDTFTVVSGTFLTVHTPDTGTAWHNTYRIGGGNSRFYIPTSDYLSDFGAGTNDGNVACINDTIPSTDYNVTVKVRKQDSFDDVFHILARWESNQTTYGWKMSATASKLYKEVNGVFTDLNTSCGTALTNDIMTLKVSGTQITAYKNGVVACSATDSSISAAGKACLGIGAFEFWSDDIDDVELDDFSVTYIESVSDSCTCPASPANWAQDINDNCTLNSMCNITGYNMTHYCTGVCDGSFTINSSLYLDTRVNFSNGMKWDRLSASRIYWGEK